MMRERQTIRRPRRHDRSGGNQGALRLACTSGVRERSARSAGRAIVETPKPRPKASTQPTAPTMLMLRPATGSRAAPAAWTTNAAAVTRPHERTAAPTVSPASSNQEVDVALGQVRGGGQTDRARADDDDRQFGQWLVHGVCSRCLGAGFVRCIASCSTVPMTRRAIAVRVSGWTRSAVSPAEW